jgi:hypothetical protein
LLSLDRWACANLDVTDAAQLLERQLKVSACFPPNLFRHITIPSENCGLATNDFNKRLPFIISLLLVIKSWKGDKPVIFGASEENIHGFSLNAAMAFEKLVTKYYCQQFFNNFGRAAQIPHCLYDN